MPVCYLSEHLAFPHPLIAESQGILAVGGDLSIARLKLAYAYGIFPWYSDEDPILWWFPDPRCVLRPDHVVVSKSMKKLLRKAPFCITCDTVFQEVISQCRKIDRPGQPGSWIHPEMIDAYTTLHQQGYAHSMEVWSDDELVGGLYGVAMGNVFFGESMFSKVSNASKYALIKLAGFLQKKQFRLIDCQQDTPHMRRMGAGLMPAAAFHVFLKTNRLIAPTPAKWVYDEPPVHLHAS